MIVRQLTLADDTALTYQDEADARKIPLETLLAERLEHAQALDPRNRFLILEGNNRSRLERILGELPVLSVDDLISKVHRLARIRFGDHEIALTAGQMEELAWRAHKRGVPVAQMIEEAAREFGVQFFTLLKGPS